jgi:hypothetical protein
MESIKKSRWGLWLTGLLTSSVLAFALYAWATLNWSYSSGERAGFVQKFSHKGWICKTWEGEMAMVSMPGTMSEKFYFTVRDDAIAAKINQLMGKKVTLTYDQHRGVPTNCFGDTGYFVTAVKTLE